MASLGQPRIDGGRSLTGHPTGQYSAATPPPTHARARHDPPRLPNLERCAHNGGYAATRPYHRVIYTRIALLLHVTFSRISKPRITLT